MIRDLELIKDITPLFEKKLILWGIGENGEAILEDIEAMGAGRKGILLCNFGDKLREEKTNLKYSLLSPDELAEVLQEELNEIMFLVMENSLELQDEIIEKIERRYGRFASIYTEYAIRWGIYYNISNLNVDESFRKNKLAEHEINRNMDNGVAMHTLVALKYFAFLPLHDDEIILVYQPGKVASSSVYRRILNYGHYALHCHGLKDVRSGKNNLSQLLSLKSGKIISLVREPIARQISTMWQNISSVVRYSADADFSEIEQYYFGEGFENTQYEWFDREMKEVFGIDVFAYPFDVERGYIIIKQGNIELLLMKMEKLSELRGVIGDFLGIEHFEIENRNIASEKLYRFAIKAYKKQFSISKKRLEDIFMNNEKVKYFYSEKERIAFYQKWNRKENV